MRSIQFFVMIAASLFASCAQLGQLAWSAADQSGRYNARSMTVPDIRVPEGFRAVRVVNGLNFPSAFTWDADGNLYILESHTVPVPMLKPKIVRVTKDGAMSRLDWRGPNAPTGSKAVGLIFHDGWLYFSHEQADATFAISRVRPAGGEVERVLGDIPVQADHDVNHLIFDDEGTLYFGVGSATNSGVVSSNDPVNMEWLAKHPQARDIPCREIRLTGQTFTEENALTKEPGDRTTTGAYQAYGQSGAATIPAQPICSSSIYRLRRGSTTPELVAWGFRNPVALAFDADGALLVGMHGADERSTRPVAEDPDSVLLVAEGVWYGWPDYSAALEPLSIPAVIDHGASGLRAPDRALLLARTKPHAALSGLTLVPDSGPFAEWRGQLLLAEMGDFKPLTAKDTSSRAGFQIEKLDRGSLIPFLRNAQGDTAMPASTLDLRNGFERPVDVRFGPDGLLYVLDFGAFVTTSGTPKAFPKTGKLFRIEPVK
jgi:glucose/arabinose dehydrogenase